MGAETKPSLPDEIKVLRFLVAEHNPTLQKSIVKTLNNAGAAKVEAFVSGPKAWDKWKSANDFGVVICSSNLPDLNGMEILKRIRAEGSSKMQPAFILLSTDGSPDAQREAAKQGADAFQKKPFSAEELIPRIEEGVTKRKLSGGGGKLSAHALEESLLGSRHEVELVFERYATTVECEELSKVKCVIRVSNNYGLGTTLTMRFARKQPDASGDMHFKPIKGSVTKTVRIPKEFGVFLLHVSFNGRVKEQTGIPELLRESGAPSWG